MLIGEYHHNIDEKNRIIMPSKFRSEIGEKIVITKGLDGCLFAYSLSEWEKITNKLKLLPFTKSDARMFTRIFLAGATICEFDKQGRININSNLLNYANIKKECAIIGVNERLEIWSLEKLENMMKENEDKLSVITENLFAEDAY
ncbi:MAG: division/cell wall cluster transcriptional repressor MraZ [bacterium]|nr:division/cell wall cluster transcriptional repressor MraZ [bacterium]